MNACRLATSLAVSASFLVLSGYAAYAASFEITNGQTVTYTQNIGAGANETGIVDQGGIVSVSGANSINSTSDGGTLINNGTVTVDGHGAMFLNADNGTNVNNGLINVGSGGQGLITDHSNETMTNNGTISLGDNALAIGGAGGNSDTFINNGTINSSSGGAYGIVAQNGTQTSTNNGIISLSGASSIGIGNYSATAPVTNNGTITVNGVGVLVDTAGVTATNNGTITTSGDGGVGMIGYLSNDTLINNHTITTSGASADGMDAINNNSTLTNNGSIQVANASGMLSSAANNTLTNNGSITAGGTDNRGMYSAADANTLVNHGTIVTSGTNVDGMLSDTGGTSIVTNYGTVHVSGTDSDGLGASENNTVTNYGTVIATGSNGYGVYSSGNNIAVINRGRIISEQANAIYLPNDFDTVTFGMNSLTQGGVAFGGSTHTATYDLSGTPRQGGVIAVDSITGTYTPIITNQSSIPAGARVIQSGSNLAVITADGVIGTSQTIMQTLDYSGDIINNRFEMTMLGGNMDYDGGTQYAAASINDASPASGFAVRDHYTAWTEAFGSYQERPDDGDIAYTQAKAAGVLAGIDLPGNDAGIRSGLYAGGITGSTDIGKNTFRTIDSNGALAGGYIGKSFDGYFVNGQLATGALHNGSSRNTGVDYASADYSSYFVSPSVTVMRPISGDNVTLVPQATLRYTSQWDTSYIETGSVENERVGSYITDILEARALLEAHFNDVKTSDGFMKPSVRVGAQYRTFLGSRSVDVNTFGTSMSFDPSGGDNTIDGVIGATVAYKLNSGGPEFYADGESDIGLNKGGPANNFDLTGRLGARWKF